MQTLWQGVGGSSEREQLKGRAEKSPCVRGLQIQLRGGKLVALADGGTDGKGEGQAKRLMKALLRAAGSERKAADGAVRGSRCQAGAGKRGLKRG